MIKKLKTLVLNLGMVVALLSPALVSATVSAQADCIGGTGGGIGECLNSGADKTDESGANMDATERVNNIIRLVINVFSLVVGVIAVIMIIVGGLKYITSGGDSGNISSAKNTILFAIVGLVVVALAQIIVKFVLQKVTETT